MSANHQNRQPNALIHEKSPYLQQHAYNPVHWMPWSDVAFEKVNSNCTESYAHWITIDTPRVKAVVGRTKYVGSK